MEVNLFEVGEENGFSSNWWFHISSKNFGFHTSLKNIAAYEVENNDVLMLKEKNIEGYFRSFWFIVSNNEVRRSEKEEIQEVLSSQIIHFVSKHKKLPYKCRAKLHANRNVRIYYQPTQYDKIVMLFRPGDYSIEDVYDFFDGLDTIEGNPIEISSKTAKFEGFSLRKNSRNPSLFLSGQRITIQKAKINLIEEKERKYGDKAFTVYLLHLINGEFELENKERGEFDNIIAQVSENLYKSSILQPGNIVYLKGRTKNDWELGDIVHNIRVIEVK